MRDLELAARDREKRDHEEQRQDRGRDMIKWVPVQHDDRSNETIGRDNSGQRSFQQRWVTGATASDNECDEATHQRLHAELGRAARASWINRRGLTCPACLEESWAFARDMTHGGECAQRRYDRQRADEDKPFLHSCVIADGEKPGTTRVVVLKVGQRIRVDGAAAPRVMHHQLHQRIKQNVEDARQHREQAPQRWVPPQPPVEEAPAKQPGVMGLYATEPREQRVAAPAPAGQQNPQTEKRKRARAVENAAHSQTKGLDVLRRGGSAVDAAVEAETHGRKQRGNSGRAKKSSYAKIKTQVQAERDRRTHKAISKSNQRDRRS